MLSTTAEQKTILAKAGDVCVLLPVKKMGTDEHKPRSKALNTIYTIWCML